MTELETVACEAIKNTGVKRSSIALDFGCGRGTYTLPAARLVGNEGRVYAVDMNQDILDKLTSKAQAESLDNIIPLNTGGETKINIADGSVDTVLLFDILNEYYFPDIKSRRTLLDECRRILKPGGFLSVYPKHVESTARSEIEDANFRLESEFNGTLIHLDTILEKGQILNFRK